MELTNLETGEVFLGLAVAQKKKYPREIQQDGFCTMFTKGWEYLASVEDLTGVDHRVLFRLLAEIDFENWISISQQTIAEDLNLKQQNVGRSLKKLIDKKIIEKQKDPVDKRRSRYRLNPSFGWKGDANQWKKEMHNRKLEKVTPLFPNRKDKE